MQKSDAVASLGQTKLLRPARIKAALAANDRLGCASSARTGRASATAGPRG